MGYPTDKTWEMVMDKYAFPVSYLFVLQPSSANLACVRSAWKGHPEGLSVCPKQQTGNGKWSEAEAEAEPKGDE